jgi:hypothetical protein
LGLLFTATEPAQSIYGLTAGSVRNSAGAVISAADVEVTNAGTGTPRHGAGNFQSLLLMQALRAESTLLECTADAWYANSDSRWEGSGQTLKLAGGGEVILLAFRFAAIEHWKVEKAVIVLHLAAESQPAELMVSLIGAPWRESSPKPPSFRETSPAVEKIKPDGWISIPVPRAMAQALADGKATGVALSSAHANQIFHSRETIQYSPFLAVIGRPPVGQGHALPIQ